MGTSGQDKPATLYAIGHLNTALYVDVKFEHLSTKFLSILVGYEICGQVSEFHLCLLCLYIPV